MEMFKHEMVAADYPTGPLPDHRNPANFGNVLSSGWCQKKV